MNNKWMNVEDFLDDNYKTTFIVGARGVGKTISALTYGIKQAYKNNQIFIYLRRYLTEIEKMNIDLKLLSDLTGLDITVENVTVDGLRKKNDNNKSKKEKTKVKNSGTMEYDYGYRKTKESARMIVADDGTTKKPVGYILALNVVSKYKSNSYNNCFLIIYDEFIDIKNKEIKNETWLYAQFALTVFRDFKKYKALFLANATNIFNCYFVDFNIYPKNKNVTKYRDKSMKIVNYKTSKELDNERNNTALAKMLRLLDDTSSLDNRFDYDPAGFIKKQDQHAKCIAIYRFNKKNYGLWKSKNYFTLSNKSDITISNKISVDDINDNFFYDPAGLLKCAQLLKNHMLTFNSLETRGQCIKEMKKTKCL